MKTNLEKNMEELLNLDNNIEPISEIISNSREIVEKPPLQISDSDIIMDDYEYARQNLKSIIESAQTSIEDLSSIASTSESPRAYEVLSTLMKTIVDANKDLLELQKKVKQLKEEKSDKPQNVTNALYVGNTSELIKLIKGNT
jgi:chromosome segregation ATPase